MRFPGNILAFIELVPIILWSNYFVLGIGAFYCYLVLPGYLMSLIISFKIIFIGIQFTHLLKFFKYIHKIIQPSLHHYIITEYFHLAKGNPTN